MSEPVLVMCPGPNKGAKKAYRCPCCGYESDNMDAFCRVPVSAAATSTAPTVVTA